jgi:hypothetical protein
VQYSFAANSFAANSFAARWLKAWTIGLNIFLSMFRLIKSGLKLGIGCGTAIVLIIVLIVAALYWYCSPRSHSTGRRPKRSATVPAPGRTEMSNCDYCVVGPIREGGWDSSLLIPRRSIWVRIASPSDRASMSGIVVTPSTPSSLSAK